MWRKNCLTKVYNFVIVKVEPLGAGFISVRTRTALAYGETGKRRVSILYAIIENGSKQYKVCEGDVVRVEKLKAEVGASVDFKVVLVSDENGIKTGADVANAKVSGKVEAQDKFKKIVVLKYKAKKNERKKQGHRQPFTQVKIEKISL